MTADHAEIGRRRFIALGALALPAVLTACSNANPMTSGHTRPIGERLQTTTVPPPATTVAAATPSIDISRYAGRVPTRWGTNLPGVDSTLPASIDGRRAVALTFDACGGPRGSGFDRRVLDILAGHDIPATVFVNERWIRENPRETEQLIANPLLRVENHGTLHLPLSVTGRAAYDIAGTTGPARVIDEIESNRALLCSLGVDSRWFRAGTAHYDDVAVTIAHDLGVRLAGFSVNADYGATASPAAVEKQLLAAPDGAIVLAHMNQPTSGTAAGLRSALPTLIRSGVHFVHLDPL